MNVLLFSSRVASWGVGLGFANVWNAHWRSGKEGGRMSETHFGSHAYTAGSWEFTKGEGEVITGVMNCICGCADFFASVESSEEGVGVNLDDAWRTFVRDVII